MASGTTFDADTNATEVAQIYASRCAGKIVLVTGVSLGGIGEATARAFAHGGAATIIITGRNDQKLSAAVTKLSAAYPKTHFRPLKLDLDSLAAVKQAAQEILEDSSVPVINILVANAGLNTGVRKRQVTSDDIETHFGVNHLAHHLFITSLLPKLRAAAQINPAGETRIILVSSAASLVSPIRFSDWNYEFKKIPEDEEPNAAFLKMFGETPDPTEFSYNIAYGQSKTANILFAIHVNKLLAKEGIYSFSLHPGFVDSNGARTMMDAGVIAKEMLDIVGTPKTIDQGSATTLVAALDPKLTPDQVYLEDARVAVDKAAPWAKNEEFAEKLWKLSEDIIKEKLGQ